MGCPCQTKVKKELIGDVGMIVDLNDRYFNFKLIRPRFICATWEILKMYY